MQLVHKENPVGVDAVIDKLQRDLFIELTVRFGWRDYDSYPRAYRNRKEGDTIPEVYTSNGDYKEVLFNDKETVTSFFLTDDKRTYEQGNSVFTQWVSIIFQANLAKLFPDIQHRADEEMIDNIFKALKNKNWEGKFVEVITGVDKVYESLKLSYDKKNFDDMGNFSIARFNFKMLYVNTNCETTALK